MAEIGIIGGGVSGMTAAIAAARLGVSVCLFEKMDRVGRKLLATGNGRCNLSNIDMDPGHFHGSAAALIPGVFANYGPEMTQEFWEQLGIALCLPAGEEDKGKLYPRSLQAASVVDCLRYELERLGVECRIGERVTEIRRDKFGLVIKTGAGSYPVKTAVLAAGGKASPKFGADGDGAGLAGKLGLKVYPLSPALCRIECKAAELKALMGVKFVGRAILVCGDEVLQQEEGEVLFTEQGLSGPPILNLSRRTGEELRSGRAVQIQLDMASEQSKGQVFAELSKRFRVLSYKTVQEALNGWIHKKLAIALLKKAGIPLAMPAEQINKIQIGHLAELIKGWPFPVDKLAGWAEAQVTVGGVAVGEIDEDLQSRKVPGLFLAGEVLDLDGDCGGYNIQWAVSSGYAAGVAAAARSMK